MKLRLHRHINCNVRMIKCSRDLWTDSWGGCWCAWWSFRDPEAGSGGSYFTAEINMFIAWYKQFKRFVKTLGFLLILMQEKIFVNSSIWVPTVWRCCCSNLFSLGSKLGASRKYAFIHFPQLNSVVWVRHRSTGCIRKMFSLNMKWHLVYSLFSLCIKLTLIQSSATSEAKLHKLCHCP